MQVKVNYVSQENSLEFVKMALSCAQCIESGHHTTRSDPLLKSSASVSVSAGGLEEGEQRRAEQAGGVIRQDLKLSITFLNSAELREGRHRTWFRTRRSEHDWTRDSNPTTTAAGETSLGLFSTSHQCFPDKCECQVQANLRRAAGSLTLNKLVPLLRWHPQALLSEAAVCRPAPASGGR